MVRLAVPESAARRRGRRSTTLWIAGFLVFELLGDSPDEAAGDALVRYFEDDEISIYVGALLFFLGSLAFLWWAAALRTIVARVERGDWLATVAFGSAIAFVLCLFGVLAPQIGGGFLANESDVEIDPGAAQALWSAGDGFFSAGAYSATSFLLATALAAIRGGFLPRWFLLFTGLVLLVLVIPLIHWIGIVFGFPFWLVLAGILLRPPPRPSEPREVVA